MIQKVCRDKKCEVPRRKRLEAERGPAGEPISEGGLKTKMRKIFRAEKSEKK
jgi:hypothetical protein